MDLTEIEAYADQILESLKETESAAEVRDLVFRLDGLYRGAQIKTLTLTTGSCMDRAPTARPEQVVSCVLLAGHEGGHSDRAGMRWNRDPDPMCGFRWKWNQGREQHYEICTLPGGHGGTHHLNQVTGVNKRKQDCSCVWATRQAMSESNTVAGSHHDDTCPLYLRNFGEALPDSSKCGFGGTCTLPAKHVGRHLPLNLGSAVKPIADRLHELTSNWRSSADSYESVAREGSTEEAYAVQLRVCAGDLEAVLMEGGI